MRCLTFNCTAIDIVAIPRLIEQMKDEGVKA